MGLGNLKNINLTDNAALLGSLTGQTPPGGLRLSDVENPSGTYYGPLGSDIVSSTASVSVDQLQAAPFWSGSGGTISEVAFNLTTLASSGGKARCGMYMADQNLLVPTRLLVDGGEVATDGATGFKNTTGLKIILEPNTLYFTAFFPGVQAPTVTTFTSGLHLFGRDNTMAARFGWVKTGFTYGALPTIFPTPITGFMASTAALVVVRYSTYNR